MMREAWEHKPVLRRIYGEQYFGRLLAHFASGTAALEIGSGLGFIREFAPNVIRTDILPTDGIHLMVNAHHLPFGNGVFDNVLGLDVLHHFNKPIAFMEEVSRVLRTGGRLLMVEPWITPFSRFIYTFLHQEFCDMSARPWKKEDEQFQGTKKAFDGNPAIPYLLIERGGQETATAVPTLQLSHIECFSSLTYLLSLGFKPGILVPNFAYPTLYRFEEATRPVWAKLAALRALIVWTKTS